MRYADLTERHFPSVHKQKYRPPLPANQPTLTGLFSKTDHIQQQSTLSEVYSTPISTSDLNLETFNVSTVNLPSVLPPVTTSSSSSFTPESVKWSCYYVKKSLQPRAKINKLSTKSEPKDRTIIQCTINHLEKQNEELKEMIRDLSEDVKRAASSSQKRKKLSKSKNKDSTVSIMVIFL